MIAVHLAQQIGAEADLGASRLQDLQGTQPDLPDVPQLVETDLRQAQLRTVVFEGLVGHQSGHRPGAALRAETGRFLVDQIYVLDRLHAVFHTTIDGFRRIGVGHDVGAPGGGFPDDRADFLFRILQVPYRIGGGCHAAGRHDLDLRCARAELVARCFADLGDAIGHNPENVAALPAEAKRRALFANRAKVRVPARLAQGLAGIEDPRTLDQAAFDRQGKAVVGPAGVAHRGEAPHQRAFEVLARMLCQEVARHLIEPSDVRVGGQRMEVGIDQARHDKAALGVDDMGLFRTDASFADLLDALTFDEQADAFLKTVADAVEQQAVLDQDFVHVRPILPRERDAAG